MATHLTVAQEAAQRLPAVEAVVQRPGNAAAVGHPLALAPHPGMQPVPMRLAALLAQGQPLLCTGLAGIVLDLEDPRQATHGLGRHLAVAMFDQLVEFAPCMHQAAGLDALAELEHRLVGFVVVAHERAVPALQELHRVLGPPARAELVDHAGARIELAAGIAPDVGLPGLARAGLEQRHRRLVGVQHGRAQHEGLVRLVQRLQAGTGRSGPGSQRRTWRVHA
ncbi:hypothetical protein D9M70_490260 [compost metagenome]